MKSRRLTVFYITSLILFIISFSIALPILCRFFFYWQIDKLGLENVYIPSLGRTLSRSEIITAFNELMDYLLWGGPFQTGVLQFSQTGVDHFYDVKILFMTDLIVLITSSGAILTSQVLVRKSEYRFYSFHGKTPYFYAGSITLTLFIVLGILVSLDFDTAFVVFHSIFFPGKTNWTFAYDVDEIINILPQQFFLNCAILIVTSIITLSVLSLILNWLIKPKNVKIIAIDVDGTLLNSKKELTEEVKLAVANASKLGIKVVIATGRPYQGIVPLLKELNLYDDQNYTICFGGAMLVNNLTGETLYSADLTKDDALKIINWAKKNNLTSHLFASQKCYLEQENPYSDIERDLNNIPLHYITYESLEEDIAINKVMVVDEPTKLQNAYPSLPQEFFANYSVVFSAPYFLEFLNPFAHKGQALKELTNLLLLESSQVMAIGDQENDLSMLEYAGYKIAMGNARDELKKVATFITADCDHDGVALAINKFALKKEDV